MNQIANTRRLSTSLFIFAVAVLVAATAINIAMHLLLAVAPCLLAIGLVVLVSYISWLIIRLRRSRW